MVSRIIDGFTVERAGNAVVIRKKSAPIIESGCLLLFIPLGLFVAFASLAIFVVILVPWQDAEMNPALRFGVALMFAIGSAIAFVVIFMLCESIFSGATILRHQGRYLAISRRIMGIPVLKKHLCFPVNISAVLWINRGDWTYKLIASDTHGKNLRLTYPTTVSSSKCKAKTHADKLAQKVSDALGQAKVPGPHNDEFDENPQKP